MPKCRPAPLRKRLLPGALSTSGLFKPKAEEDKARYSRKKKHPKQDQEPED